MQTCVDENYLTCVCFNAQLGRESSFAQISADLQVATATRKKNDERFQMQLFDEIKELKEALAAEQRV